MELNYLQAILLGILQGLTEFLPVSSSGHLVILQNIFGLEPQTPAMILFDLAVHLGTVVAVLIYFRHSLRKYSHDLIENCKHLNHPIDSYRRSAAIRFSTLAAIAIVVTGLFYITAGDKIKEGFEKPHMVAICWLVTATLLLLTDIRSRPRGGLRNFGMLAAVLVGLAQGAALFPGISRSGATICVAVLLGLRRRWAGEFSFLIGVPAIIGATLLEGISFFANVGEYDSLSWGPTLAATAISAIVGWAALALLFWMLRKAKLKYFAIYCYLIAIITLAVLLWP